MGAGNADETPSTARTTSARANSSARTGGAGGGAEEEATGDDERGGHAEYGHEDAFSLLIENGVDEPIAEKFARRCRLNRIYNVVQFVRRKPGVKNPAGLIVSMLQTSRQHELAIDVDVASFVEEMEQMRRRKKVRWP